MEENIIDLNDDNYQHSVHPNTIKCWYIFVVILLFIVALFISTFVVCGTNGKCRKEIPTLHNLLESTIVTPFLIMGLTAVFILHFLISIGIYFITKHRAGKFTVLLLIITFATYISIIITLFVFPFTAWDNDYANYLIICSLCLWMFITTLCLMKHYRNIIYRKKSLIMWNITAGFVYTFASIGYFIVQTFFPSQLSGILACEICSGVSIVVFLAVSFIHIWKLEAIIKVPPSD
jgi:hypothetical protein